MKRPVGIIFEICCIDWLNCY